MDWIDGQVPEMIERVAKAISAERWGRPEQFDMESEAWRNAHRDMAYAALLEALIPTDAMIARGEREALRDGAHDCEVPMADVWCAMMDEARR
jgi:hypothetical protein